MLPRFPANISHVDFASAIVAVMHAECTDVSEAAAVLEELEGLLHAKWTCFAEHGVGTYNWTFCELGWVGAQVLRNHVKRQQDRAGNAFLGTELLCVIRDKCIGEYTLWETHQAIYRLADAWLDVCINPSVIDYVGALETSVARFTLQQKPRINTIQTFAYIFHDIRVNLLPMCLQTTYCNDEVAARAFWDGVVFPCVKTAGARMFLKAMIQKHCHRPGDGALFGQEMGEPAHVVDMERANKQLYGPLFNTLLPLIKTATDFSKVMDMLPLRLRHVAVAVAFDSYLYSVHAIPNFYQTSILHQALPSQLYARLPFLTFIASNVGLGAWHGVVWCGC